MRTQQQILDDINYANDPRTQGRAKPAVLYRENGDEMELPTHKEVCPVCNGEGKHVNPSIDAGGLTSHDFDRDPEFYDDYMGGVYDVTCNHCGGLRVVDAVNWDALDPDIREAYQQQLDDDAAYEAERRAEIMMGC